MATATQLAPARLPPTRSRNPLALWHLLSLDAPTVAVLWTWFLARANHIHLPLGSAAAMAVAVWMLYAADRLLDARLLDARLLHELPLRRHTSRSIVPTPSHDELEARHLFHHRHRPRFLAAIAFAAVALAVLLPGIDAAAIHLYLIEGALLSAWFLILHATRSAHRLPKEIAVGLFFAAATFIPTVARNPGLRLALLPAALLFTALCSLNCLYIYAWEHRDGRCLHALPPHATTRFSLGHLPSLTIATAVAGAAILLFDTASPRPIAAACALSALLLLLLDRSRRSLSEVTLRAAADLALLTPLILLPFLLLR